MSQSKMTLIGLYNFDEHLFDTLTFPDGIDKSVAIDSILMRGGEFEVLFSDPNFMKATFYSWSVKWRKTFEKWLEGYNATYNPIENYDRFEEYSDTRTGHNTVQASDTSTSSGSGTTTNTRSAYDSASYAPHDKAEEVSSGTNTSSSNSTGNTSESVIHTAHLHGDIGITTPAQMLEGHYEISKWNLYEHIADVFLQEYVIAIY